MLRNCLTLEITHHPASFAGSISTETFQWQATDAVSPNANATLTDTAFTVNDAPVSYLYSLSGVMSVPYHKGASGNNLIDASGWSGKGLSMDGFDGADTLKGERGPTICTAMPAAIWCNTVANRGIAKNPPSRFAQLLQGSDS